MYFCTSLWTGCLYIRTRFLHNCTRQGVFHGRNLLKSGERACLRVINQLYQNMQLSNLLITAK
nr:MAG TPA: hypothetical protein [Caudoviricetes sp.]